MFRAKTVFVIGAGASFEVGLPVGIDLLKQIVQLTDCKFDHYKQMTGDRRIIEALKRHLNEGAAVDKLNEHIKAGWQLAVTAQQAMSIDNIIDAFDDEKIELLGKLGIVRAILSAEASSNFFQTPNDRQEGFDLLGFRGTWYDSLTKLLVENLKRSKIQDVFTNLSFINFNYDRCVEHYLVRSLAKYYGVDPKIVVPLVAKLDSYRPYGIAGHLPQHQEGGPVVRFGGDSVDELVIASGQIRTFSERVDERIELAAIKGKLENADRVIFLGFGYHRQNLALLKCKIQDHTQVLGTAFGMSKSDMNVVQEELEQVFEFNGNRFAGRLQLIDATCNQFFNSHWRTITSEAKHV